MKNYKVQSHDEELGWRAVPFAESRFKAYCDGWVNCMGSMYPSRPMRIIRIDTELKLPSVVVRETKGNGKPHTN